MTRARRTVPPTAIPMMAATFRAGPEPSWVAGAEDAVLVVRDDNAVSSSRTVALLSPVAIVWLVGDEVPGISIGATPFKVAMLADELLLNVVPGSQSPSVPVTVSFVIGPLIVPSHCAMNSNMRSAIVSSAPPSSTRQ